MAADLESRASVPFPINLRHYLVPFVCPPRRHCEGQIGTLRKHTKVMIVPHNESCNNSTISYSITFRKVNLSERSEIEYLHSRSVPRPTEPIRRNTSYVVLRTSRPVLKSSPHSPLQLEAEHGGGGCIVDIFVVD